jgi:hypothetical protein
VARAPLTLRIPVQEQLGVGTPRAEYVVLSRGPLACVQLRGTGRHIGLLSDLGYLSGGEEDSTILSPV